MKVCVYTLGCKVNQYESGAISAKLLKKGCEVVSTLQVADVYIINTCAVTNEAERKSRQAVSKMQKLNPNAKIIVCGCSSQSDSHRFEGSNRLIFGTSKKGEIVDSLEKSGVLVFDTPTSYEELDYSGMDRVRSYIKVQDGCDNFCSYCIVPYLRGRSRSREIESIKNEIAQQENENKEFVITGINITDYGKNINSSLCELMQSLISSCYRVRLGSLEVSAITPQLLQTLSAMPNFCEHFHLSLQSGSDSMLKKMNRHYTSKQYFEKVQEIRKIFPHAGITTDIIAGFPTETEAEHRESVEFVRQVGFSDIHAFSYSKREGTAASRLIQIHSDIIKSRTAELLTLKKQLKAEFIKKEIDSKHEILIEEESNGYLVGYTRSYIRAYILSDAKKYRKNTFVNMRLISAHDDGGMFSI